MPRGRGHSKLTQTVVSTGLPKGRSSVSLPQRGGTATGQAAVMELTRVNETKGEAFVRLAEARVSRVLYGLDLIQNLASYPHDARQAEVIIATLLNKVGEVNDAFREGGRAAAAPRFKLD